MEKVWKAKARSRICDYFHRTSQHVQKAYKSYTYVYTSIHKSENVCKNDLFLRFLIWFMVIVNVRDSYSYSRFTSNEEQKKFFFYIKETKCCRVRYEWEKRFVSVGYTKKKNVFMKRKVFFLLFHDERWNNNNNIFDIAREVKTHFAL